MSGRRGRAPGRRFLHENALSLAAVALFLLCIAGQAVAGLAARNQEAREHGRPPQTLGAYLASGTFVEAVFENWESEFLQMAVFVVLTKFLRQKGSSESKPLGEKEEADRAPRARPDAPWAVRKGGVVLQVYQRSLSIALVLLFAASFVAHAHGGMRHHNQEQAWHGGQPVTFAGYFGTAQFWEESFQNWQSEFLSVAVLVLLSIVLRERGSPQSKPVDAPNDETGGG